MEMYRPAVIAYRREDRRSLVAVHQRISKFRQRCSRQIGSSGVIVVSGVAGEADYHRLVGQIGDHRRRHSNVDVFLPIVDHAENGSAVGIPYQPPGTVQLAQPHLILENLHLSHGSATQEIFVKSWVFYYRSGKHKNLRCVNGEG